MVARGEASGSPPARGCLWIPACAGMTSLRPGGLRRHFELLLEERLPELELLLPERLPPLALARSLCARLFCVLALPPLLAAWARLERPDDEEDDLEEEEELRDAIACSLVGLQNGRCHCRGHLVNLGRPDAEPVGMHSAST